MFGVEFNAEEEMRMLRALVAMAIVSVLTGCGYNTIVTQEQTVTAAWAEVLSQYQRRADLIPNIVETVKGEAISSRPPCRSNEARAKAPRFRLRRNCPHPQAFAQSRRRQGHCPRRCRDCWSRSRTIRTEGHVAFQSCGDPEGTETVLALRKR